MIIEISKCCKNSVYEDFKDNPRDHHDPIEIYRCSKCKLECEIEEACELCLGTGEVSVDESDGEGHIMRGVGTRKCECRLEKQDE